jgi:ParB-like chromosome segregation protein Spo0J
MYMESSYVPKAGPDKGSESGIDIERNAGECSRRAVTLAYAGGATPVLQDVPLHLIRAVRNPRQSQAARTVDMDHADHADHDVGHDPELEGLARSLGSREEPRLAEPPVVEEMPEGYYRLCAGERRVQAARLAGWTDILCIIYPPMDPAHAHTLSLVENLHRAPMHPLEEISSLCVSRLLANADARNLGHEARTLLEEGWAHASSAYEIIRGLESLLRGSGWKSERPDVSWKAHLDDLGISMAPWERKRKLRLLNLEPDLQEKLRHLDITEAALRALGTLEPDDQRKVVDALISNPSLARKVRRVARARRDGFYSSIEDALAEVQGLSHVEFPMESPMEIPMESQSVSTTQGSGSLWQVALAGEPGVMSPEYRHEGNSPAHAITGTSSNGGLSKVPTAPTATAAAEVQDAVLQILECADRLAAAMKSLETHAPHGTILPEPWGAWSRDALDFIEGLFLERTGKQSTTGQRTT